MTSLPMARRDADDFAALVDGTSTAESARLASLMATVELLRSVEPATPRPEFLTDLRGRLMVAADELLVPAVEVQRPTPARQSSQPPLRGQDPPPAGHRGRGCRARRQHRRHGRSG